MASPHQVPFHEYSHVLKKDLRPHWEGEEYHELADYVKLQGSRPARCPLAMGGDSPVVVSQQICGRHSVGTDGLSRGQRVALWY